METHLRDYFRDVGNEILGDQILRECQRLLEEIVKNSSWVQPLLQLVRLVKTVVLRLCNT